MEEQSHVLPNFFLAPEETLFWFGLMCWHDLMRDANVNEKSGHAGWTIITGASSGIGAGFARALGARGVPLILVARRGSLLRELETEIGPMGCPVRIIEMDLSVDGAAGALAARCHSEGWSVDTLINNAGLGFQKDFLEHDLQEIQQIHRVNMDALVQLTRAFLPAMVERRSGKVLNIGSAISFYSTPHFAIYAASKAHVLAFSEALDEEVRKDGVRVMCLCPGPVATEFGGKAGLPDRMAGTQSVDEVVDVGLRQLDQPTPVMMTSWMMRVLVLFSRMLPRGLRCRLAGRTVKLERKKR